MIFVKVIFWKFIGTEIWGRVEELKEGELKKYDLYGGEEEGKF